MPFIVKQIEHKCKKPLIYGRGLLGHKNLAPDSVWYCRKCDSRYRVIRVVFGYYDWVKQ